MKTYILLCNLIVSLVQAASLELKEYGDCSSGPTSVHFSKSTQELKNLLERHASLRSDDEIESILEKISKLIQAGADLDVTNSFGDTSLMLASVYGKTDLCSFLIKKNAQLDLKNKRLGMTALLLAASKDKKDVCKLLLTAGANMKAEDPRGMTALMWAAFRGQVSTTAFLLGCKADDVKESLKIAIYKYKGARERKMLVNIAVLFLEYKSFINLPKAISGEEIGLSFMEIIEMIEIYKNLVSYIAFQRRKYCLWGGEDKISTISEVLDPTLDLSLMEVMPPAHAYLEGCEWRGSIAIK